MNTLIAAVLEPTIPLMVHILVWLVIVGLILWLFWWLIDYVGLPQPFNKVAKVIVALIGVLMLVNALLKLSGSALF